MTAEVLERRHEVECGDGLSDLRLSAGWSFHAGVSAAARPVAESVSKSGERYRYYVARYFGLGGTLAYTRCLTFGKRQ